MVNTTYNLKRVETDVSPGSFEKEAMEASNLYTTALNIKDKESPDSLAKIVNAQHLSLEKEKEHLTNELKKLKNEAQSHERDFLDQRQEKGEVISPNTTVSTLQDSALSFFLLSYVLFGVVLLSFAFMPPLGSTQTGVKVTIGYLIVFGLIWGLIFSYA